MQTTLIHQKENIYTVSRLNNEVRFLLEDTFPFVWVEGEISNFAAPNSGHWYFSLKDSAAQVRCAMFRMHAKKLIFVPKDGMHVLIKARVSLYENRGEFQLIVEHMEERGEGKLQRAFELLKKKLEAAGLFAAEKKKPIPLFPKSIGVITSPTGAAIRDILNVLNRRYPLSLIIIYPTLVQGEQAAPNIVNAIQIANQRKECEVLILARGGGSLEDLWPFNEESVANAIYLSHLPIISGIGHEVDFTIADFVADHRAPTPSAAAEIATPHIIEIGETLKERCKQLNRLIVQRLQNSKQQLNWVEKHLSQHHPKRILTEKMQRLDFFELTLIQQQTKQLANLQAQLKQLHLNLHQQLPIHHIRQLQSKLQQYAHQLIQAITAKLYQYQSSLANGATKLDALSPLATLKRGFAIAETKDKVVLQEVTQVKTGETIYVRLMKGQLTCLVEKISQS